MYYFLKLFSYFLSTWNLIFLQSGLVWDSQLVECLTSQVKVLVILTSVTFSGSWYQICHGGYLDII